MRPEAAQQTATIAGLITAPTGLALLAAPHLPAPAGLGTSESRAIGIIDLVLSVGLIVGRPRWPWATARAIANVPTAFVLARSGTPVGRALAAALVILTALDGAAARSLRASGR